MPWTVLDYRVFRFAVPFAGQNPPVAVMQLPAVPGSQVWRLERAAVQVTYDPAAPNVPVYVWVYDTAPQPGLVPADATVLTPSAPIFTGASPLQDIADNGSPVTVTEGNQLTIVFACPNGNFPVGASVASARLQIESLQGSPGQPTPVAGAVPGPAIPAGL